MLSCQFAGFIYRKLGNSIFLENYTDHMPISFIRFGLLPQHRKKQRSPSENPVCPLIIISYVNRVFYETAVGLQDAITALGIENVEIWGDMSPAFRDKYIEGRHSDDGCSLPIQIAIAPHEDTLLLSSYIVWHMEQTWSVFSTRDMSYKHVVENALSVWLMSSNGMRSFLGVPIKSNRIYVIPLYTRFDYALKNYNRKIVKLDKFVVFGSHTPRREEVITELEDVSEYAWGTIGNPGALIFSRERDNNHLKYSKVSHICKFL